MNAPVNRDSANVRIWWILTAWTAFALVDASRTTLGMYAAEMHHDWPKLFLLYFLDWLPWPIATPAILKASEHLPSRRASARIWATHLGGLAVMFASSSLWFACLDTWLDPWLAPGPPPPFAVKLAAAIFSSILPTVMLYAFIVAIGAWLRSRETLAQQRIATARLNEQLAVAELSALRQQIEPHFLFNTLNAVVGLLRERRIEPAIGAIVDLSELLRGTLQRSHRPFVTLSEELELLSRYLEIQKTRFGERLAVESDVPTALHALPVPAPILQPLVENAIKHGIAQLEQGGRICIRAERSKQALNLLVYNDGPSLAQVSQHAGAGIGLANLRKRLEILCKGQFSLELRDHDSGVEVLVSVPVAADYGQ